MFLNTAEFAEVVAYRVAATGVSTNVTAVFEDGPDTVLDDKAKARISEGEVASPAKGDQLTRNGAVFTIVFVGEILEGMFLLSIEREEEIT